MHAETTEAIQTGWSEVRLIAAIRWMLATTALTIIFLDPKEPDNSTWEITYALLAAYVVYSSILYILAIRRSLIRSRFEWWAHWIDVAWFTVLIGLSFGTNRIFFFGFLFAILVASFRRGFKAGISVVIVSTLAITIVGYTTETASPGFEGYGFDVYRFMLRPAFLILLGYLMAHWGESEIQSKRRLALLKDIALSNPRFGADRTINSLLARLRIFFHADLGLMIVVDPHGHRRVIYRAESTGGTHLPEEAAGRLIGELCSLPDPIAVSYNTQPWPLRAFGPDVTAYNVVTGEPATQRPLVECQKVANTLDAFSFISVPTFRHHEVAGRIYLSTSRRQSFTSRDVQFLVQVLEHASPIIENIRLVDTLASDAAEHERRRIARDIHDSIIQPYIGFQIALAGLRRKLAVGKVDLAPELEQLANMTAVGVSDLRSYVARLKSPDARESSLLPAVKRFVGRFSDATGINVRVEAPKELRLNDSLAAEAFQILAEGLSNIRRHTEATQVALRIECDGRHLRLRIENDGTAILRVKSFTPKSIAERASSLNGVAWVDERDDGGTIVNVEVPL